jgi:hypothetical protein
MWLKINPLNCDLHGAQIAILKEACAIGLGGALENPIEVADYLKEG